MALATTKIPYDVFNHIIHYATYDVLMNLYFVNKIIRKLCNEPFCKVLLEFRKNQYFNEDATSDRLNDFLNDITGNDPEMLKDLQLAFGATLMGSGKQVIVLNGYSNGKSTFVSLINQVLGYRYAMSSFDDFHPKYYTNAYIIHCVEPNQPVDKWILKRLSGGDSFYGVDDYNKCTLLITANQFDIPDDRIMKNRLKKFTFRKIYTNNGHVKPNKKQRIVNMRGQFMHRDLQALLTFLLEGCRQ